MALLFSGFAGGAHTFLLVGLPVPSKAAPQCGS